jgi:CRISPR-associated endonuclease/helicase Cas3
VDALRVELFAPVASFRDPMFPGVSRTLPVPPPSTVRGMLAAATGDPTDLGLPFGCAAHAEGRGVDHETYHPIAADGSNPAIGGRVRFGKGGATLRERPFLTHLSVTLWVPGEAGRKVEAALARPTWALRLGRSQDLVHLVGRPRWTTLNPTEHAVIGHALAPAATHAAPEAAPLRLPLTVSQDRMRTSFGSFLWCAEPAGEHPVEGAYRDADGQAVWLLDDERPPVEPVPGVWAKSVTGTPLKRRESLSEHSLAVRDAARDVADRIGSAGPIAQQPAFWRCVERAALLHDAGKVAEGFQFQLRPSGERWGERHEVLSLAYVDLLTRDLSDQERLLVATGVAFHHRPLTSPRLRHGLDGCYPPDAEWERIFGFDPDPPPGRPRGQVPATRHAALLDWLAGVLDVVPPDDARRLWERARDTFAQVRAAWGRQVDPHTGLLAVLLQGAVTLADHSGSAHVPLQRHMPLPADYLIRLAAPYPYQEKAANTRGHLVLLAPTGSGKTEAGLAWASAQLADMPARPRLAWVLPYRASIDAAVDRFTDTESATALLPEPGREKVDIAVLHATAARTLLTRAVGDDQEPSQADARKAKARVAAMRLFSQRVRVATPHQLLRAAIAGPRYASVLLEQANGLFILDELHAYDPATFGRICAAMRLWERLGGRVAVLSATLAEPMIALVREALTRDVTVLRAPPGTAPDRHRLVLDPEPITGPESLGRILAWIRDGHSVLVVVNTVRQAQALFADLAPQVNEIMPGDEDAAILLHSRFRARDRAAIEARIMARHPERKPGEPARRGGGLVVSTQALEVSLCLDFDRGVTLVAPIEAVAQRAGRVNRRGRHPDGPVEFRVHHSANPLPYERDAVEAASAALAATGDQAAISETTVDAWLAHVYATDWGQQWAALARDSFQEFTDAFLTFREPFADRDEFAARLDEQFDTLDALLLDDREDYQRLADRDSGDVLLAAGLLIPIRHTQRAALGRDRWHFDRQLGVTVIDAPYDSVTGLELPTAKSSPEPETIL